MTLYKGTQKICPIITVSSGGGNYTIVETSIERSYGIYSWAENYQLGNMDPVDYIPRNTPLVLIFDSNGNLLYSFFADSSTETVNYYGHSGIGTKVETSGLSSGYGELTIYVGTATEEDDYYGETMPIDIYWTVP